MPTTTQNADVAKELMACKTQSHDWLAQNFYPHWTQVYKSYKCERDPEIKPNSEGDSGLVYPNGQSVGNQATGSGDIDPSQTSIGMPDTWSLVRRQVARVTAQPPNLRFRAKDPELADKISWKCMRDWDRGGVQRIQKKHVTQAMLFGWSVRAWSWECLEYPRNKRVDPRDGSDPEMQASIQNQYAPHIAAIKQSLTDPNSGMEPDNQVVMAHLLAKHGRAGLLPVNYNYKQYEGPRADFLFIGDCYPEPNFQSIQTSRWFIVRRRRSMSWMKRVVALYPELADGFNNLVDKCPDGHDPNGQGTKEQELRRSLLGAIDRAEPTTDLKKEGGEVTWTIYERHVPGPDAKLAYVAEGDVFIGEIPYPYDLDGKIAFTELVLIDDLLSGIGDSHARVIRGLQQLHDRQVNVRFDLIYNILRPLVWTSSQELYDNPEMLKRGPGFRLIKTLGGGEIGVVGEQSAIASAAAGLQDESAIQRLIQQASGENNMSMTAGVDPQQGRTATGARLMAYNQDILSLDMNAMFTQTSLTEDAKMLYLLNRSEMPEGVEFDTAPYQRQYDPTTPDGPNYQNVTPQDFQNDGEIEAVAGSTLGDEDDAKVSRANTMFAAATSNPGLFNIQKARDEFLIAMGKGKELGQWVAPPMPLPSPEPPKMAVSAKFEDLPQDVQVQILAKFGVTMTVELPDGTTVPLPGGPTAPPPGPMGPGGPPPPGLPPHGPGGPPMPPNHHIPIMPHPVPGAGGGSPARHMQVPPAQTGPPLANGGALAAATNKPEGQV